MRETAQPEPSGDSPRDAPPAELQAGGRAEAETRWRRLELLLVFVAAVVLQMLLHHGRSLYDTDSFVHLAMARLYGGEHLVPAGLEAARFSILHEGFGDKEWLFHALLAPLVALFAPLTAGHVALALLNGFVAVVLAALGRGAIGRWGLFLPFALVPLSGEVAWRLVRLRPELLALPLLLLALTLLADRRPRLLGVVTLLFTWSYTAFHALVGLLLLAWIVLELRRVRGPRDWSLALYPILGASLGLVLHPHFPHNLVVWIVQNVQFFLAKGSLDVGTEIRPNLTEVTLLANVGLWLALVVLWRCSVPAPRTRDDDAGEILRRRATVYSVGAVVFGLLYLLMSRFSLYSFPLLTLAILYLLAADGRRPSSKVRLPWAARLDLRWAVLACVLATLPGLLRQAETFFARTDLGPDEARLTEWRALSRAIPDGAEVAADWRLTGVLMLWAPQGRYLNVLDPVFMATPHPRRHEALRRVLSGTEPDVPSTVRTSLDSDYLAVPTVGADPRLVDRLRNDPRSRILHDGSYLLARFRDLPSEPSEPSEPVPAGALLADGWQGARGTEPASSRGTGRLRGYVDGEDYRFAGPCMTVERSLRIDEGTTALELASHGAAELTVDGRIAVTSLRGVESVLGRGLVVPLDNGEEPRRLRVTACATADGDPPGFYLRVLPSN